MDAAPQDNRRAPRSKVLLSAALEWPGRTLSVVLRDLSGHGALIETNEPIEIGSKVDFRRNDLRVPGRVAWSRGSLAGIAFDHPLMEEMVLRYINRPLARTADPDQFRRPGFNRTGMLKEGARSSGG